MADHQNIIDQIRAIIAATDQTKTPRLVELAAEYAALCNEVNARLRKCTDYLRRGLRAEAIHLAEEHPVLLEMVSSLDLAGQPQWANLCAMYELTPPPPLLMEAAQELNEAYSAAQSLQATLDRHRRLALECAPLIERLAVMRALEAADPASTFWDADIRTFETACIKKLKVDATAAIKARDYAAISRLLKELETGGWRVETPPELGAALKKAQTALAQQQAIHQARLLMHEVDAAYGAMNADAVAAGARKIRALLAQSQAALPEDLAARLTSAERWSREQAERARRNAAIEQAVSQLSQAISDQAPLAELEVWKKQVIDAGGEVPEQFEESLAALRQKQDDEIASRARRRWMITAAAAVLLFAAGGVTARAMIHQSRGNQAMATLLLHYNSGDLSAADQDLKKFAGDIPYVMSRADIKQIAARLADDRKADTERVVKYQTALGAARAAIDSAGQGGQGTDAIWAPALASTAQVTSLARTPDEKTRALQLQNEIAAARKKISDLLAAGREQQLRQSLTELQSKVNTLAAAAGAGTLAPDDAALQGALHQASLLAAGAPADRTNPLHVDAMLVLSRLKDMAADADRRKSDVDRKKTERIELDNIRAAGVSPEALKFALTQFIQRCPTSDHTARFKKTLARVQDWEATDDAASLLAPWGSKLDPDFAEIPDRLTAIAAYTAKHVNSPWAVTFTDYTAYLTLQQKSAGEKGPWKGEFHGALSTAIFTDLKCMTSADGKRYYLLKSEVPTHDSVGTAFNYVTRGVGGLKRIHGSFSGDPVPSPQSALSADLAKSIDAVGHDWQTLGFTVATKIVEAKEVDSILRVILMEQALNSWQLASSGADDGLLSIAGALGRLNVDDLPWMDPANADANAKRDSAEKVLVAQAAALKKARDAVVAKQQDLFKRLQFSIVGRGVLLFERPSWRIVTVDKPAPGVVAYAITQHGLSVIGQTRDAEFVVDASAVDESLDGSMIFIVRGAGAAPEHK